jgi:hypothetical protein
LEPARTDLSIYSRDGRLRAAVLISGVRKTSPGWAAEYRRNLLAHGPLPPGDFFLIVTPDRVYLWKDAGTEPAVVPPDYAIDGRPIFSPYLEQTSLELDKINKLTFELLVDSWFTDLIWLRPAEDLARSQSWLVESGFLAAVRDGRVIDESAA